MDNTQNKTSVVPLQTENITVASATNKKLPIRLISKVVKGFGRGSRDLGIPTANLSREDLQCSINFDDLPCGIYWGFAKVEKGSTPSAHNAPPSSSVYKAAVSIGFNPTYHNTFKTIEPHLIADPSDTVNRHASCCGETLFPRNFYDQRIRLSVVGFLREELPFEGLEKLITAIKDDIKNTERLCDEEGIAQTEKDWVGSDRSIML
jgi:FAD synthase